MSLIKQIQEYMLSENLQPGDSMPSETELSKRFGASRGMIREALQYFRMHGMIESKPRRGIHIKSFLPENPFEAYLPFCTGKDDLKGIGEMRMVIECGLAPVLVAKASPEQLNELEDIAKAMYSATYRDLEDFDIRFHQLMLSIAGNKFISCLAPFTVEYFHRVFGADCNPELPLASYRKAESHKHLQIVDAIRSGNAAKLRTILEQHYAFLSHKTE